MKPAERRNPQSYDIWQQAVMHLRSKFSNWPTQAVVLGSGLSDIEKYFEPEFKISFADIPGFHAPTVAGHGGQLLVGRIGSHHVLLLQGRVHFYEGHRWDDVCLPVRTLKGLGLESVLLTNAAGGLDPDMRPGDFMIIRDHINMTGSNPLVGPNVEQWGPRFPDMTETYNNDLSQKLKTAMSDLKIRYFEGTYCGLLGPTYETPAEIRHLQKIGGHAVGMSTVAEAIAGHHIGLKVGGLSLITNLGAGLSKEKLDHKDVKAIGVQSTETLFQILQKYL